VTIIRLVCYIYEVLFNYLYIEIFFQKIIVKSGPMVPGTEPREASDRLFIFQNQFDALFRKYTTYSGGEELFGLPVTEYPELLNIK